MLLAWVGHENVSHHGCHDHLCRHDLHARRVHRGCLVFFRPECGPNGDLDVAHHRLAYCGCLLSQPHGHERLVRLSAQTEASRIKQADGYCHCFYSVRRILDLPPSLPANPPRRSPRPRPPVLAPRASDGAVPDASRLPVRARGLSTTLAGGGGSLSESWSLSLPR